MNHPIDPHTGPSKPVAYHDSTTRAPLRGCHPPAVAASYLQRGWWRPETTLDLFDHHVRTRAHTRAVSDPPNLMTLAGIPTESLTWSELNARADDIAAKLFGAGVGPGDVVIVVLPNSVVLTATYLALWRIGAIASPLPMSYRRREIGRAAASSAAVALITVRAFNGRRTADEACSIAAELMCLTMVFTFGEGFTPGCVSLDGPLADPAARQGVRSLCDELPRSSNDCITVCWTSGTEATPKGVPRCHGDWLAIAQVVQDGMNVGPQDVIMSLFPMVNMAGLATGLLPWLLGGAHLVQHHPLDVTLLLRQIRGYRVTHAAMAPAVMTMLTQHGSRPEFDLSSLQKVGAGGAPLPVEMVRHWHNDLGIDVINFFGSNEGVCLLGTAEDIPDPQMRAQYLPNYATPARSWVSPVAQRTNIRLVGLEAGVPVTGVGARGELRIKGPTIFAGYLAGTADTSPFDDDGYLRSGDVFEMCGAGGEYLRFVDRAKEIVIRGGMNISPAEVEALLIEHPAVADVAIVGYPDDVLGEKCCAVVVAAGGQAPTLTQLVDYLREQQIASFKLPEMLVIVTELRRSPVGKLARRELRDEIKTRVR
ncbi:class I adenylate-forming enzyme family protein [Mycobacterium sp. BMJ-28]